MASAVDFVKRHDLDGFDVDWEYPGLPGDGNPHRPEDKENFTALMADLRAALDREGTRRGGHLLLTFAAGASQDFLAHTEMAKVQRSVDFVNLMTYDFRVAGPGAPAGHHANLYPSPADPRSHSADGAVKDFLAAGVPASKLVLGVPFYGRAWEGVGSPDGLYREGRPPSQRIDSSHPSLAALVGREGWVRAWDAVAQAPFLPNEARKAFVTYEDEESLRIKSRYVLEKKLGGVMFWEYHADRTGAPRHARRGVARRGRGAALRSVALPAGPRRRGPRRLLGESDARRSDPPAGRAPGAGNRRRRHARDEVDRPDRRPIVLHVTRYEPYREPGNIKVPFWLQPDTHYAGAAWYQRDVDIPPAWRGRRVVLHLERPHWQTRVARRARRRLERQPLDAARARPRRGRARDAPADDPGRQPLVVDVGVNSHSVTDHTQGNWNGIVGRIELRPTRPSGSTTCRSSRAWRRGRRSCAGGSATRRAGPATERSGSTPRQGTARPSRRRTGRLVGRVGGAFEVEVSLGAGAPPGTSSLPRSTGSPRPRTGEVRDTRAVHFGLREIGTQGTQFSSTAGRPSSAARSSARSSRRRAIRRPTSSRGSASSASRRRTA